MHSEASQEVKLMVLRSVFGSCMLLGLAIVPSADQISNGQPLDAEITLKSVKYDELTREVVKNRGKVVVVDFWGIG